MKFKSKIFLCFLFLAYMVYAGQLAMLVYIIFFYIVGLIVVKGLIRPNNNAVYDYFNFFVLIYGTLILLSQIELITDPYETYFVHNDAAMSFYTRTMEQVTYEPWDQLLTNTLFSPFFFDYFLAQLFFGFEAKLAVELGIENLRLAMRFPICIMGALTVALMLDCLYKRGECSIKQKHGILIFGLCSYLYITSAIFSRDICVCLVYTALAYVFLLPKCNNRFLKMIVLIICAFGCRPEHGALASLYAFGYYYNSDKISRTTKTVLVALMIIGVVVFLISSNFIEDSLSSIEKYDDDAKGASGGVFSKVYAQPFPLNKIAMTIYMIIQPLPPSQYIVGGGFSWLTLPFILSPYLMSLIVVCSLWYVFKFFRKDHFLSIFIILSWAMFSVTASVSPDLRRSFAPIPGLLVAIMLVNERIPVRIKTLCKKRIWPVIIFVELFFQAYILM